MQPHPGRTVSFVQVFVDEVRLGDEIEGQGHVAEVVLDEVNLLARAVGLRQRRNFPAEDYGAFYFESGVKSVTFIGLVPVSKVKMQPRSRIIRFRPLHCP